MIDAGWERAAVPLKISDGRHRARKGDAVAFSDGELAAGGCARRQRAAVVMVSGVLQEPEIVRAFTYPG
jgi:hypothetical protein